MPDFSTVACTEVHGTRKEGLSYKGGPTASVQLRCAYADRFLLRTDLMNNGYWPYNAVGATYIPRCQKVDVTPEETDYIEEGQAIGYKYALLDVDYSLDESAGSGSGGGAGTGRQLYTESFSPQLSVERLDSKFKYWHNMANLPNGSPDPTVGDKFTTKFIDGDNPPRLRRYTFTIQRTFYNWLSVPISFMNLLGYVNDKAETFPSLGLTFPIGTLQFVPINSTRAVSTEGTAGYTIQVNFIYKEYGWNLYPVIDDEGHMSLRKLWTQAWDYTIPTAPTSKGVEVLAYQPGDFSDWIF